MKQIPSLRPSVIIDTKIPFIKGVLEPYADVRYMEGSEINVSAVANADALVIRTRTRCDEQLLKDSTVRFIATATIGTDHIDTAWCDAHNVAWTNAAGCNSGSVFQYIASVFAWLLLHREIDLPNITLGIVGCGHVGSKVARLGKILGMNVIVNDPPLQRAHGGNFVSLDYLLQTADIVTLHTPLTREGEDKTFHLIDENRLAEMKPTAWLINSSRGEVIDEQSLEKHLTNKKIKGAILDVWEHEPEILLPLLQKTVLATPHIAGYSTDGKAAATMMSVQALSRFFHLPLKNWQPESLPKPINDTTLTIDAAGKTFAELYAEIVPQTYNISADDQRLRSEASDFEKQRGNYPVRREFQAYSLFLKNASRSTIESFAALGFMIFPC